MSCFCSFFFFAIWYLLYFIPKFEVKVKWKTILIVCSFQGFYTEYSVQFYIVFWFCVRIYKESKWETVVCLVLTLLYFEIKTLFFEFYTGMKYSTQFFNDLKLIWFKRFKRIQSKEWRFHRWRVCCVIYKMAK